MRRLELIAENLREPVRAVVTGAPTLKRALATGLKGNGERGDMLTRFEEYAWWTVPAVFPKTTTSNDDLGYDLQSLGAQLSLNVVSKMMLVMFNPSQPFFKSELTKEQYTMLMSTGELNSTSEVDLHMSSIERNAIKRFESTGGRLACTMALLLCVVTGNALLEKRGDKYRVVSYRDYDAKFDAWGVLTDLVLQESIQVGALPEKLMQSMLENGRHTNDVVMLYTGCKRIEGKYLVWQELEDILVIDDGFGIYDEEKLPYAPMRWSTSPGRDAGVGLVELTAGDWHMFRTLAETDIDLVSLMTDILTLVDTSQGSIKMADVLNAKSGAYIAGNKEALHSHAHDIRGRLQDIDVKAQQVIRRLSQMFLFTGNVIRDSERTTAQEVQITTQEIAQVHMLPYVTLGEAMQRPLAGWLLHDAVPALGNIKPNVLTGVTEMTRMAELNNRRGMWNDVLSLSQIPPHVLIYMKLDEEIKAIAAGWGVDPSSLRTKEEVEAEQQREAELQQMTQGKPV